MKYLMLIFAIIGIIAVLLIIIGIFVDVTNFDKTKGGYEYPYNGWSGSPVQWKDLLKSDTGLVKEGYIVDILVDGSSGMISFKLFGFTYDWRTFSDRALIVHKPREAFICMGFNPKF